MAVSQRDFLRITEGLNPGQLEAVTAPQSTVLVVAGAGSGKTTVASRRIAMFIAESVEPQKILAMTFGNKAAKDTKDRVSAFIPEGKFINSYTYHAFALREVIQPFQRSDFFKSLGFSSYINLIDDKDSTTFLREARDSIPGLKEIFKLLEVKPKRIDSLLTYHRAYGKRADDFLGEVVQKSVTLQHGKIAALSTVTSYVDKIITHLDGNKNPRADVVESIINFANSNAVVIDYLIAKLWKQYEFICQSNNGIDFDDVLILASRLIGHDQKVREHLVNKFTHFVLDEFQDTNKVQYEMLQQIFDAFQEFNKSTPNLFYVGDTRQAIFRFRGADAKYMSQIKDSRHDPKICSLTENYRSSQQILNVANIHARSMKGHLTDGYLASGLKKNTQQPEYSVFESADDESNYIANEILNKISAGVKPSDIAILYRTSAVKNDIERALAKNKIPYVVVGDASFYDSKEISDTISFLRMLTRSNDHLATSRVIDCFKGVTGFWYRNAVSQANLTNFEFFEKQAHLFTAKSKPFQILYERMLPIVNHSHNFSIREICQKLLLNSIESMKKNGQPVDAYTPEFIEFELLEGYEQFKDDPAFDNHRNKIKDFYGQIRLFWSEIYRPHIEKYVKDSGSDNVEEQLEKRFSNINKLFEDIINRVLYDINSTIDNVVEDLILASDVKLDDDNAIQMLTIHKSKGLEYSHVFLPGLEQSIFFKEDEQDDFERIQDESQIFYVGLTRARENLHCSSATVRMVNGETRANIDRLCFLTEDLLPCFNYIDHTSKITSDLQSATSAWEHLTMEIEPTTANLLAQIKI
jgi:DNA helicase-2/ATP-dependent DNA helicase PcrA